MRDEWLAALRKWRSVAASGDGASFSPQPPLKPPPTRSGSGIGGSGVRVSATVRHADLTFCNDLRRTRSGRTIAAALALRSVRKLDSGKETCPAPATVKIQPQFEHAFDFYASPR